jgi:hypothetical protein
MKQKILWMGLILTMVFSSVAFAEGDLLISPAPTASDAVADNADTVTEKILPIEAFLQYAETHDLELSLLEQELEIAQRELNRMIIDNADLDRDHNNVDQYVSLYTTLKYDPAEKQVEIDRTGRDIEKRKEAIALEAKTAYLDYQTLTNTVRLQKQQLEVAQADYALKQKAFELGTITSSVLDTMSVGLLQQQLTVSKAEQSLKIKGMEISDMLGFDIETTYVLPSILKAPEITEERAETADLTVLEPLVRAQEDVDLAQIKYDIYLDSPYGNVFPIGKYTAQRTLITAQSDYESTLRSERIQLLIDYNVYENTDIDVAIADLKYQTALTAFNASKLKYDLGMETYNAYQTAFADMSAAYGALQEAEKSRLIQALTLENELKGYE